MVAMTAGLLNWVLRFALILIRIAALFTISPIFGRSNMPAQLKIAFSALVSLIVVSLLPPGSADFSAVTLPGFALMCLSELIVGLALGFMTALFFSAVFTAGQIIDTQIGFGMVQVYDVQTNIQIPVTGSLFNMVLLISAFVTGAHVRLIQLLIGTFEVIGLGQAQLTPAMGLLVLDAFSRCFVLAVQVAMPVIASGMLAEIALGIVVRTAPQMNIFVIGIPIKTLLGLIMMILILPVFVSFTGTIFDAMYEAIDQMFGLMAP